MLSVLTQIFSNRSHYVVVDGCHSKLVNVVSGMHQCSLLGPQLFLLYTAELFHLVKNKLNGYSDVSTLVAVGPCPADRVAVTESMNRDLELVRVESMNRVSAWCDRWGMKLNAGKTKTMIFSRSREVHPQLTSLTLDRTVLEESAVLVILGVTFDAKLSF